MWECLFFLETISYQTIILYTLINSFFHFYTFLLSQVLTRLVIGGKLSNKMFCEIRIHLQIETGEEKKVRKKTRVSVDVLVITLLQSHS